MNREKHFHPLAALHLLRKTILLYLICRWYRCCLPATGTALRAALRAGSCAARPAQRRLLGGATTAAAGRWMPRATVHGAAGGWACGWTAPCAPRVLAALMHGAAPALPPDRCLPGGAVPCRADQDHHAVSLPGSDGRGACRLCCCRWNSRLCAPRPRAARSWRLRCWGPTACPPLIACWPWRIHQSRPAMPRMPRPLAFAHLRQSGGVCGPLAAAWARRGCWCWPGTLFCISLARSAAQAAHYTVWRTDTQLGSRGGPAAPVRDAAACRSPPELRRPAAFAGDPGTALLPRVRHGRAAVPPGTAACSSGRRARPCCKSCCPASPCRRTRPQTSPAAARSISCPRGFRWGCACC